MAAKADKAKKAPAKKAEAKKADGKKAPDLGKIKRKAALSVKLSIFMLLVCALIFASSTLVFAVCMLPTLVAAVIDKSPQKTLWLTIGAVNLAGTVPAWFALWDQGAHLNDAITVLSNPSVLLIAFASAAGGWVIHMNVTPLVAALIIRRNEGRVKDIEKRQKELIRKWGEDIARTVAEV